MHKPFKIKYASELAGVFVILGLLLLIVGIFIAAHSQAWFEGSFVLRMKFDTKTGSLGLREGNEVVVLSTLAGRVGKVMPTAEGQMETTLIIKNSFQQFVRTDSVAKVKKKFVAAGDAYVEIEIGEGSVIQDGDFIVCRKDEEIMETAQKLLADVQEVVLPLIAEVQGILGHVNVILGDVEAGKGIAGSMINDEKMSAEIKDVIDNSNALIQESQRTFRETTRMIRAAQRSWLLRRYMKKDDEDKKMFAPMYLSDDEFAGLKDYSNDNLDVARIENKPVEIALNACDLGYCALDNGDYQKVQMLLAEARAEMKSAGEQMAYVDLLEAAFMRKTGRTNEALDIMRETISGLDRSDREINAQCRLMEAELLCDAGRTDEVRKQMKDVDYYVKKVGTLALQAAQMHLRGRVTGLAGDTRAAAEQFDAESLLRQQAGQYRAMGKALEAAAGMYEKEQDYFSSSDRYFKAGRSVLYSGSASVAEPILRLALAAANKAGNQYVISQANAMLEQIEQ